MKEILRKYQKNELSPVHTEGVEKKLLATAIEREMRKNWASLVPKDSLETVAQKTVSKPSILRYIMGAAASIALLAVVWQLMGSPKSATNLADGFIMEDRFTSPSVRMDTKTDEKNWADAKNAYRDGKFEAATKDIEAIPTPTTEQIFYKSLSQIYQKAPDYNKAAEGFKTVFEQGGGTFKDEARWFYALCLVKLDRKSDAKTVLEDIEKAGSWKAKEAKLILDKLR